MACCCAVFAAADVRLTYRLKVVHGTASGTASSENGEQQLHPSTFRTSQLRRLTANYSAANLAAL
jgi:hypothetical protein